MLIVYRLLTGLFSIFVILPILWILYAAFIPASAMLSADLTSLGLSLQNFARLAGSGLAQAMIVSVGASGLAVAGQLVVGLMLAYAVRAGLPLLPVILVALALPTELLMVPLYRELQVLGILDTFWALVVPYLASPLVVFLLVQSLRRLPWNLVEAARLDGASEFVIVWRIIAPLLRPEMVAAGVLGFAIHWNLVLYPKVMTDSDSLRTVQVLLSDILQNRPFEWGLLGAAALATTLPLLVVYIVFERQIVEVFERSFR